jgi:hypothetical protein
MGDTISDRDSLRRRILVHIAGCRAHGGPLDAIQREDLLSRLCAELALPRGEVLRECGEIRRQALQTLGPSAERSHAPAAYRAIRVASGLVPADTGRTRDEAGEREQAEIAFYTSLPGDDAVAVNLFEGLPRPSSLGKGGNFMGSEPGQAGDAGDRLERLARARMHPEYLCDCEDPREQRH